MCVRLQRALPCFCAATGARRPLLQIARLRLPYLGCLYCFKNQHSCDAMPILFLFGRVHAMRSHIDRETMYATLNWYVGQLLEVIPVVLLKYGDRPARAADVYASKAGIELYNIRTRGQRHCSNRFVGIEIEHGKSVVALTGKEGAPVLRVERHAVISGACFDRVVANHLICRRINDRKLVEVLEVNVDPFGDGVIERYTRFAIKVQGRQDGVGAHIDYGYSLCALIGDIELMVWGGVRVAIRLALRRNFANDFHRVEVDNPDRIISSIRCVDLTFVRYVFEPFGSWRVHHRM